MLEAAAVAADHARHGAAHRQAVGEGAKEEESRRGYSSGGGGEACCAAAGPSGRSAEAQSAEQRWRGQCAGPAWTQQLLRGLAEAQQRAGALQLPPSRAAAAEAEAAKAETEAGRALTAGRGQCTCGYPTARCAVGGCVAGLRGSSLRAAGGGPWGVAAWGWVFLQPHCDLPSSPPT